MKEKLTMRPDVPINGGNDEVLDVETLSILHGQEGHGAVPIVADVSIRLRRGETLGLVGESGSGKSLTALGLIGLLPTGLRRTGRIDLFGRNLVWLSERELESVRGAQVSMVFQDPMTGLNPVRTVGSVLAEAARRHRRCSRAEARELVIEGLAAVGIPSPRERFSAYPHQLSGGLRQRVMTALALINNPSVILADEPTTALDTTVQAQIIQLLKEKTRQAALLLITHDLGVAAELCDRIAVMYSGRIVEEAPVAELLAAPRHPYTVALLAAAPSFDRSRSLTGIPGVPPSPFDRPTGCPFHPRCRRALPACAVERPPLTKHAETSLACWNPHD
jgi:oligopeptide/dipeptide ABC transporter ATP-binding protein